MVHQNSGASGTVLAQQVTLRSVEMRNQLFIMSKFSPENSKPEDIIKSIDASLTRIKRDYLDVYQPHWPQPGVRLEDILETLEKLKLSGKIRFSGLSNFSSGTTQGRGPSAAAVH